MEAERRGQLRILGVRIDPVTMDDAILRLEGWIAEKGSARYVIAANTHVVLMGRRDRGFQEVLDGSSLTVPDGMPLVWAANRRGYTLKERVYGPDLMWNFIRQTLTRKYRHFFLGTTEETLGELVRRCRTEFPGVEICGAYSPPFGDASADKDSQIIQRINAAKPDILWVGMGCPRQERWMFSHRDAIAVSVMVGVGLAFDLWAGRKERAPGWMQKRGLEWLFRLAQEPGRLWKRYLVGVPLFIYFYLLEEMRKSRANNG